MKLNKGDIKSLIKECVQQILEVHGAINDSLSGIADIIIERIKNGETKFTLTKDEISQFYPYKNCPERLPVLVKKELGIGIPAKYSPDTRIISVSPDIVLFPKDSIVDVIMHELTHWVNDAESNGGLSRGRITIMQEGEKEQTVKAILYLFDPSEMQARVSQFKWALKRKAPKYSYEAITHLKYMSKLISLVDNETYEEYENSYGESESYGTIVEGLLSERAYYKSSIDGKDRYSNFMSENEFNVAKEAIIKRLRKKYAKYKSSIDKNIYDFSLISSNK